MSDQRVQRLLRYCQRRQAEVAAEAAERNAYEFVVRHLAVVHQQADDLLGALLLWSADRRQLARQIRQQGVGLALADTLETAARVYEECAARLVSSKRKDTPEASMLHQTEDMPQGPEQTNEPGHVLRIELRLRVENNTKWVRGKKRSREEIEDRVLRRYAMEKPWKDGNIYYLTLAYDTEEELERIISDEILREAWLIADDRACFIETDVRALDGTERSW